MSTDDLEGLQETLEILATPGLLERIHEGEAELDRGEFATPDDLRADLEARRVSRRKSETA